MSDSQLGGALQCIVNYSRNLQKGGFVAQFFSKVNKELSIFINNITSANNNKGRDVC